MRIQYGRPWRGNVEVRSKSGRQRSFSAVIGTGRDASVREKTGYVWASLSEVSGNVQTQLYRVKKPSVGSQIGLLFGVRYRRSRCVDVSVISVRCNGNKTQCCK